MSCPSVFTLDVPTLPNAPSADRQAASDTSPLALRLCRPTGFVENALFEPDRIVYSEDYHNEQHGSAAFRAHMDAMADLVEAHVARDAAVVEVGCGKGAFFNLLDGRGFSRLKGFDTSYAGDDPRIERRYVTANDRLEADFIVLRHTLEHVPNPYALLDLLAQASPPHAQILIEVPCFDWIRAAGSLWDLTYEHVNYFTKASLGAMFRETAHLAHCFDGQYLALTARLADLDPAFARAYASEDWEKLDLAPFFTQFDRLIADLPGQEGRLFVWGAGTKGVLLCHYLAQRAPTIEVASAIDINPAKQNRFTPGAATPILSPAEALANARDGDGVVVCNPNYLSEVRAMVAELSPYRLEVAPLG